MNKQLFQVGDVVSCPMFCREGESGLVSGVYKDAKYPVRVDFPNYKDAGYTMDGKYTKAYPPTLQHGPMNWSPNHERPKPPLPQQGSAIWVSDNGENWHLRASHSKIGESVLVMGAVSKEGDELASPVCWKYWLPFDAIKLTDQE